MAPHRKAGANTRDAIELVKVHANERADVVISALGVNDVTALKKQN